MALYTSRPPERDRAKRNSWGEREETQPNRTPTGAWGTTNAGIDRDRRSFIRGIE